MTNPTIITAAQTTSIHNPRLRLLNKLRAGETPLMTFMAIPSARMAQIVASTGVDAVIIDCEHGHISDDSMHHAVGAIAAAGVSPIVRIRSTAPDLIKRALDAGAHGLMVPMVNTAEQAAQVVQSSKFPPFGTRGQGSPFPGMAHGLSNPEYLCQANETLLTMVQIETAEGVENVDAICATPGVDLVFIGPNDLALSVLGYVPARGDEAIFNKAISRVVGAARQHGKWVGRLVNNGSQARDARGVFDTLAITGDTKALQNWYTQELAIARAE